MERKKRAASMKTTYPKGIGKTSPDAARRRYLLDFSLLSLISRITSIYANILLSGEVEENHVVLELRKVRSIYEVAEGGRS